MTAPPPARRTGSHVIRALRHRNYRLFFSGQAVSLIGTWMTKVATSWLVFRLTGSVFLLGLVNFFGQLPLLVVSPLAGVWVDRWNRHRVLVVTQVLSLAQSAALAVLTLTHHVTVAWVIGLQVFQGLINAFDTPGRQAFVIQMVEDRADLPNAIALNSTMVTASRVLGPSIGGVLIAAVGEGWCFGIDALSYVAVIASLLSMRSLRPTGARREARTHVFGELRDALLYVGRFMPIRAALLLLAAMSFFGTPYMVLMPAFATDVLHGGPHLLGFLMASAGAGAMMGALYMASRPSVLNLDRIIPVASAVFGLGLCAFSLSRWVGFALIAIVLVGAGFMVAMAATNTLVQTIVDEELRGRVMGFFTMAVLGVTPLGSLLAGTVAARIGIPWTLMIGGALSGVAALGFAARLPRMREVGRRLYLERGVLIAAETDAPAL